MRYELYVQRDKEVCDFLYESDSYDEILQHPAAAKKEQYLVLDNHSAPHVLYPPTNTADIRNTVVQCKRIKFLCVHSKEIVLNWDEWFLRAWDEAQETAEKETAAIFEKRLPHCE